MYGGMDGIKFWRNWVILTSLQLSHSDPVFFDCVTGGDARNHAGVEFLVCLSWSKLVSWSSCKYEVECIEVEESIGEESREDDEAL
jgi:hypothetical protein